MQELENHDSFHPQIKPTCGSSQWLPTLLPRSRRRPAGALRVRTLSALARSCRSSGVCFPRLHLGGSQQVLGSAAAPGGSARQTRAAQAWCFRVLLLAGFPRGASTSEFAYHPPAPRFLLGGSLFSPNCDVLLAFCFRGAGTRRSLMVIQAFRFHPYPLLAARRWRRILGGKVNLHGLSFY